MKKIIHDHRGLKQMIIRIYQLFFICINYMENSAEQRMYYKIPYFQPYWKDIRRDLEVLEKKEYKDTEDLIKILKYFCSLSNLKNKWQSLEVLEECPLEKTKEIFSNISKFVLRSQSDYQNTINKFHMLERGVQSYITFSKQDIILLMCFTALCLNTLNYSQKGKTFHDQVNFIGIYCCREPQKLSWILNYFDVVFDPQKYNQQKEDRMTITRTSAKQLKVEDIMGIKHTLKRPKIIFKGSIEDWGEQNTVKIDFANKFIGGGSMWAGCVQQQIMFLNHPQLYVTMLLCEVMAPNQAIGMHGFKKYFKNKGYADTTSFNGYEDSMHYTKDCQMHVNDYIVAIDAQARPKNQYCKESLMRQINKSYAGFKLFQNIKSISTGNWGCGVFGGNPQYKFMIQWISATLAKKDMIYYPFGDKMMTNINQVIDALSGNEVGIVFRHLLEYQNSYQKTVFQYISEIKWNN